MTDEEQLMQLTEQDPATCSITFKVGENELIVDQSLDVTVHGDYSKVRDTLKSFFHGERVPYPAQHEVTFKGCEADLEILIRIIMSAGGVAFFDRGQRARKQGE